MHNFKWTLTITMQPSLSLLSYWSGVMMEKSSRQINMNCQIQDVSAPKSLGATDVLTPHSVVEQTSSGSGIEQMLRFGASLLSSTKMEDAPCGISFRHGRESSSIMPWTVKLPRFGKFWKRVSCLWWIWIHSSQHLFCERELYWDI